MDEDGGTEGYLRANGRCAWVTSRKVNKRFEGRMLPLDGQDASEGGWVKGTREKRGRVINAEKGSR